MMNFILGTVAGGLIACIVTITAARHPEVQSRLGLVQPAQAAVAPPPSRAMPQCPPPPKTVSADAKDGTADALFSRRRFWYVSPQPK